LPSTFIISVFILWGAICAVQDAYTRQISNVLTFPAGLVAMLYLILTGHTLWGATPVEAGASVLLVLLLTLPGYYRNQFGAGDIKMLLVLALSLGFIPVLICFATAGAALLLWRCTGPHLCSRLPHSLTQAMPGPAQKSAGTPYAPFLFSGMLMALASA